MSEMMNIVAEHIEHLEDKVIELESENELWKDKYEDQERVLEYRNYVIDARNKDIKILKEYINNQADEYEDESARKFLLDHKEYQIQNKPDENNM